MFGKVVIAFSTLCALANAGVIGVAPAVVPAAVTGHDSAVVSVKQDTHSFGYKVDETNARSYLAAAPAPIAYAAPAPVAVAHAAPLAYAAAPAPIAAAPLAYGYGAAPAVAVAPAVAPAVVAKTGLSLGAPIVKAYAAAPAVYAEPVYAKAPYAFGYSYGSANVAVAPAAPVLAKTVVHAAPVAVAHAAPLAYNAPW